MIGRVFLYFAIYLLFVVVLACTMPEWVRFAEQWSTFYWDRAYIIERASEPFGIYGLVEDFFLQFFYNAWSAAFLVSIGGILIVMILDPLFRRWLRPSLSLVFSCVIVLCGTLSYMYLGISDTIYRFKGQMCLVQECDWQTIISQSEGRRVDNLLEQNMLNLALAETGQLGARLRDQPCRDVNSLFVLDIQSPYVAALLSDVYWSMGEIAMSQMYAFEANEKVGNLSPRLLQRLALTNIVYGQYAVAAKYLRWLEHTLFYRSWSEHYRNYLNDEAVMSDPILRAKRSCIPADNGFPSAGSVVYDLQQILVVNPSHSTSRQYLEALSMLYGIDLSNQQ